MRVLACLGDKTTYGEVLSASATWFEGNKAIAQTGDLARCNNCNGAFPIIGTACAWSEQQPYVATGDRVACACPNHVVYGSATQYTSVAAKPVQTSAHTSSFGAPAPAPAPATSHAVPHHSSLTPTPLNPAPADKKPEPFVCSDPDQMEELANYIADEINRNIYHPSVLNMKKLLSYDVAEETRKQMELPWYANIGMTNPQAIGAANGAAAMALWTERVGQGRDWDHKKKIPKIIGGVWHKQGKYDYFYDIWSNIHYGYVGMAGGLSESVLSDGAGLEQIVSDSLRKSGEKFAELLTQQTPEKPLPGPHRSGDVEGLRAWNDAPDRISIGIGVQLYKEQPSGGITAKMVMDKVLTVSPTEWGEGVRVHKCETN